jgi:hypothetical protein
MTNQESAVHLKMVGKQACPAPAVNVNLLHSLAGLEFSSDSLHDAQHTENKISRIC